MTCLRVFAASTASGQRVPLAVLAAKSAPLPHLPGRPMFPLLAALALSAPTDKPDPKQHGWHTDYAAAKAEAKRTGKPLMLVFRCDP